MTQQRHIRQGMMAGCAAVAMLAAPAAHAYDALIEGAKQCTQYFPIKEREQGIPVHLLAAISSIETGRYHKGLGMALPWPWTINVEGKGYFFQTKAEAVAETKRHLQNGRTSIDVGCMQVNLKHHPKAFATLEEAFDPEKNVGYAATFLRSNYGQLGNSWVKAAAAYHSRTPSRGNPYLQKVAGAWQKIVTKVQQAQARSGGVVTASDAQIPSQQVAALPVEAQTPIKPAMRPIESARNVKVISVNGASNKTIQRAPVMVISTGVAGQAASYTPSAGTPQASSVRIARGEAPAPAPAPRRDEAVDNAPAQGHIKRSPTFVFSN